MDMDFDTTNDVGLGEEDKGKVQSNQTEWYKGEKGRTDRVALIYFHAHTAVAVSKLVKQAAANKSELTDTQKAEAAEKVKKTLAEKLGKSVDQLEPADLLDIREARFKAVDAHYKKDLGFVVSPLGPNGTTGDGPEADKLWKSLPEKKTYLCTVLLGYPTDRDGEVERDRLPKGWWVKPWRFDPGKFDQIRKINRTRMEEKSTITSRDLYLSCKNTDFQQIDIKDAGPAIWIQSEAFKRIVLAKAVTLYPKLNPFRKLSTDELREKLGLGGGGGGGGAAPGSEVTAEDFAGVLNNV